MKNIFAKFTIVMYVFFLNACVERRSAVDPIEHSTVEKIQNENIKKEQLTKTPSAETTNKVTDIKDIIDDQDDDEVEEEELSLDDIAVSFAGIDHIVELCSDQKWDEFSKIMDDGFLNFRKKCILNMQEWQKNNLSKLISTSKCIFYPFGGPDVLYPITLFPEAEDYVLLGLELTGNTSDLYKILSYENSTDHIQYAMKMFFLRGYFITYNMTKDLYNDCVRGVLPIVLVLLARDGASITSVENFVIDEYGKADYSSHSSNKGVLKGIKISFLKDDKMKRIYYVRCDAADSNSKLSDIFLFLRDFKFGTLLKSASYILHDSAFSKLREFIIKNSLFILQDDTGIPYKLFPKNYKKYFFGQYKGSYFDYFAKNYQKDLYDEFINNSSGPLNFPFGYNLDSEYTNLLLVINTEDISKIQFASKIK